jgi:signal transduction histidine kinase/CheY-like chemotaxis protein
MPYLAQSANPEQFMHRCNVLIRNLLPKTRFALSLRNSNDGLWVPPQGNGSALWLPLLSSRPEAGILQFPEGIPAELRRVQDCLPAIGGLWVALRERWELQRRQFVRRAWLDPYLEALPDLILLLDRQGTVVDRLHAEKLPRLATHMNVHQSFVGSIDADTAPLLVQACELAISLGVTREIEFTIAHHGEPRHYEARFIPVDDSRCAVTIRDIQRRKTSEAAILDASREAQEANRSKSSFLANMSHEIRTPMNGILGMLQLMQTTLQTAEQQEYAESISTSADHLLNIINDILDLSKIEAGHVHLENREFELRKQLSSIGTIYGNMSREKNLDFVLDVAPDVPEFACAASDRIWQVLNNLLGNAVKFTQEGRIKLRASASNFSEGMFRLRVEVEDSGIGIPHDRQERIFEPFTQADSSTTRRFGGTGLGLTICRQLITAMDGEIFVRSLQEVGSTFGFEIPLSYSLQFTPPPTRPRMTTLRAKRKTTSVRRHKRILVAEDNPINRKVVTRMLERLGAEVVVACDGKEVLAILALDMDFDGILMDVQMPELDGISATEAILATEGLSHLPIVALTAHAMRGDDERCIEAGMQDYLSKPVRANELARVYELVFHSPPGLESKKTPL